MVKITYSHLTREFGIWYGTRGLQMIQALNVILYWFRKLPQSERPTIIAYPAT